MIKSELVDKWQKEFARLDGEFHKHLKDKRFSHAYYTSGAKREILKFIEDIKNLNGETVKRENDFGIYCKSINNTCVDSDDCDNCIHPIPES